MATVDPEVVRSLFQVVARIGVDGPALWLAEGLPPLTGAPVPLAHDFQFRGAVARTTGDRDVGVTLAGVMRLDDYGLLGASLLYARSLRDATQLIARLIPLWQRGPELLVDGASCTWRPPAGLDGDGTHVDATQTVFRIARLAELLLGAPLAGVCVEVPRPLARPVDPWARALTLRVGGGWSVHFPSPLFDCPRVVSDTVRAALDLAAAAALDAAAPSPLDPLRRALAARTLPAPLAAVARDVCRSPRSVQRDLAAAGISFRALHDDEQRRRAEALLRGADPIDTIAARLGFGTASAVTRAFRRWTGETPARFRAGRRERD